MVALCEQYFIDYKAPLLENLDLSWIIMCLAFSKIRKEAIGAGAK